MANNYYSTITSLAWILGHYFYGAKHYVYLAKSFDTYGLPNPKSSNPIEIYRDLYHPWHSKDDFDKFIQQTRLNLRKGVMAQEKGKVIHAHEAQKLRRICDKVAIVFLYPLVLRVDLDAIPPARLKVAGSGKKGSSEYLVEDLPDSEIDAILFCDFDGDSDFVTLVSSEIAGSSKTLAPNCLRILQGRC